MYYEKIKKCIMKNKFFKILINCIDKVRSCIWDLCALGNFMIQKHKKKQNDRINVVFICQYIPAWSKMETVYTRMKQDDKFCVYLLCVPSNIKNNKLNDFDSCVNDTYQYYVAHGYHDAINAQIDFDEWYDLKSLRPDFVFYPRPYNSVMPKQYNTRIVSQYTKICSIMYAINMTKSLSDMTGNHDFFRNVYCYFAESQYALENNIKSYRFAHKLGLRKTVYYGSPALEAILLNRFEKSSAWDFSENEFRVLWTPRWTTDLTLGGSNFFELYPDLLTYAEKNPDVDFLFRPHPLTFENFINTGEMTEEEVNWFKKKCNDEKNISLDEEKEYKATIWKSSVLITDISGFIPEYFITEKPIIFCATNMILELQEYAKKMMQGFYVVYNAAQLFSVLENLKKGLDPLASKRKNLIVELFGDKLENASGLIVEELKKSV